MTHLHNEFWEIMSIADPVIEIDKRSKISRSKRLFKIQISNERISQVDAILRNVTETGAGIQMQTELERGERVWITIKPLEPISGTVAWSKQHLAGLEFDELIDLSLLNFRNVPQSEGEGLFKSANGYHVFDRFKPVYDIKRPALKPRK